MGPTSKGMEGKGRGGKGGRKGEEKGRERDSSPPPNVESWLRHCCSLNADLTS